MKKKNGYIPECVDENFFLGIKNITELYQLYIVHSLFRTILSFLYQMLFLPDNIIENAGNS